MKRKLFSLSILTVISAVATPVSFSYWVYSGSGLTSALLVGAVMVFGACLLCWILFCLGLFFRWFTLALQGEARKDVSVKTLVVSMGLVVWASTAHAQEGLDVGQAVQDGLAAYFGGGAEIPVRDSDVRAKEAIEVIKQTAMLIDMLIQAADGGHMDDNVSGGVLEAITELSEDGYAHGYGGDVSGPKWNDAHAMTHTYPHGGWLRNEVDRGQRSLITQRMVMQMLKERKEEWGTVTEQIWGIDGTIAGSEGRNQILKGIGSAVNFGNSLEQITQSLIMAGVNSQAAHYAQIENERMAEKAQEREILLGFGKEPQKVTFREWGL